MKATTQANKGLSKRCGCPKRTWHSCGHPYYLEFYHSKSAQKFYGGKSKHKYSLTTIAESRNLPAPRDKDAAQSLADIVRAEIRSGTFVIPHPVTPLPATDPSAFTVNDVVKQYIEQHVMQPTRRPTAQRAMRWALGVLQRTEIPAAGGRTIAFGQKAMKEVITADIDAIRAARRAAHAATTTRKGGEVGTNRLLARLRHLLSFARKKRFITQHPFRDGDETLVALTTESARDRRLMDTGEAERLIQCATPHLADLIRAALATCGRFGELSTLQVRDVQTTPTPQGETPIAIVFRAHKTKTAKSRTIPIGATLAPIIDLRLHRADGTRLPPEAYIFGTPLGEKIASIKKAWMSAVLRAHGHAPTWTPTKHLSAASRAAYREINLHFHDLRREGASQMIEAGCTLVEVQEMLGHGSPKQTATYLATSTSALVAAVARTEAHGAQLAALREAAALPTPPPPSPTLAPSSETVQ